MAVRPRRRPGHGRASSSWPACKGEGREIWLEGEKVTDPSTPPEARGRGALAGAALRPPARGSRHLPLRLAGHGPAGERHAHPAEEPRGPRAAPRRLEADRRRDRRDDGPDARLPELHLRLLRGARRRLGPLRERGGRARTSSSTRSSCATTTCRSTHTLINPQVDRSVAEAEQGGGRDLAAQGRRHGERHRRPRRPHARDARAVRGRARRLPGLRPAPPGREVRDLLRDPDGRRRASSSSAATRSRASATRGTTRSRRASTRWTPSRSSTTSRSRATGSSSTATRSSTARSSPTRTGARTSSTRR